jgi:hypothetical protein|tara:strand:+ start:1717 stop:1920 length:204 start_codon:yes stop_codon:yes gene_type:complete
MTDFPNMPNGYSYSWTQSYSAANYNFAPSVNNEMAVIEAIDHLVDAGLIHPTAVVLLDELLKGRSDV